MDKKERASEFLKELYELYRKYNISIAHEDNQGAFILEDRKDENIVWMSCCMNKMKDGDEDSKS